MRYADELIYGNTTNTEKMFTLSECVEEELIEIICDLNELDEEGKLPQEQREFREKLWVLQDQLRILNNLHPNRILTWEDVSRGYF